MNRRTMWIGALYGAIAVAFVGGVVSVSGIIPMQATQSPGLLDGVGDVMFNSAVYWRAPKEKNPVAGDPHALQDGLRRYGRMCVGCHGAPGIKPMPMSRHMLPQPPDIAESTKDMTDGEIFYIVDQGIRMTGMPAFGPTARSKKDLWSVVAAVRKLDSLTDQEKQLIRSPE